MLRTIYFFGPTHYYREYFKDLRKLKQGDGAKLKRENWWLKANLIYTGLYYLVMYWWNFSDWNRRALFDYIFLLNVPPIINFAMVFMEYTLWTFIDQLYSDNIIPIAELVERVLIYQDNQYFVYPKFRGKPVSVYVRKGTFAAILVIYCFVYVLCK